MRHIDLFSGIGGFAYAAKQVWGGAYKNAFFCDNDKFCQAVLRKNFGKEILIYDDIRFVSRERFIADTNSSGQPGRGKEVNSSGSREQAFDNLEASRRLASHSNIRQSRSRIKPKSIQEKQFEFSADCRIDLLTGGFPCQPFSQAGKRRGTGDDRYLWPEMLRVIKEFKPRWIIGENVNGITNMAQQQGPAPVGSEADNAEEELSTDTSNGVLWEIIQDLEHLGYTVQPLVIPACAVNAPHRRDRIWIIAHNNEWAGRSGDVAKSTRSTHIKFSTDNSDHRTTSNTKHDGGLRTEIVGKDFKIQSKGTTRKKLYVDELDGANCLRSKKTGRLNASNSCDKGLQGIGTKGQIYAGQQNRKECNERGAWDENWLEVATRLCHVDDGLSRKLVRLPDGETPNTSGENPKIKSPLISYPHWRVAVLKAGGNAIVPEVAKQIMEAIKELDS
jgi:site-specific DNA-cytosine methylase